MNEKQLKSKLREYHLPTHGSRQVCERRMFDGRYRGIERRGCILYDIGASSVILQAMMSRLQEFTLQYNAQCDSLIPKTRKYMW